MEHYLVDKWPGTSTLEEVIIWGLEPLITLNEVNDRLCEETDGTSNEEDTFFYYERKSKLNNLEMVLRRYDLYMMFLERRLKELSPDDPLIKDPESIVRKELEYRELKRQKREAEEKDKPETRLEFLERMKGWAVLFDELWPVSPKKGHDKAA